MLKDQNPIYFVSVIFPKTRTDKRDFTILIQQIGAILMMDLHKKRDLMEV